MNITTLQSIEKEFNEFVGIDEVATLEHVKKCNFAFALDTKINTAIIGMKKKDWQDLGKSFVVKAPCTASAYKDLKENHTYEVGGKGTLLAYLAKGNLKSANNFSSAASEKRNEGKEKGVKKEVDCLTAFTKYIDNHIKDLSIGDTNALISIIQVKLSDKEHAEKEKEKAALLAGMSTDEVLAKLGYKAASEDVLNPIGA